MQPAASGPTGLARCPGPEETADSIKNRGLPPFIINAFAPVKSIHIANPKDLPSTPALIIPSRLDLGEAAQVALQLKGAEVTFLMDQDQSHAASQHGRLSEAGARELVFDPGNLNPEALHQAIRQTISEGHHVIFVPAPARTQTGATTTIPSELLKVLLGSRVPVVPLEVLRSTSVTPPVLRALGGPSLILAWGARIDPADATLASYLEALLPATERAFSCLPFLNGHLANAVLRGLKHHGGRHQVVDGLDGSITGFDKILAAALVLSKEIRKATSKERIAIVLPPGRAGFLANIATLFAGKIPVNLNFTASTEAIKSAIRQSGIDKVLTADKFVRKLQTFPWPPTRDLIFLERVMPPLKPKIALWLVLSKILPAAVLGRIAGVPTQGGDKEAVLLFTSGSSGEPKGVPLTHRNVLGNVTQFGARLHLDSDDSILACLPLFHSFGSTVTLWFPCIHGISLTTYPSPLETQKLAELVHQHRVTVLISTPTFLRGYLRRVNREQLASLKLVVTGAEKLPGAVSEAFTRKFGKPVLEGYGLTETSPVTNVNLPDPQPADGEIALASHRPGSVGQLMPGLALRLVHPDTGERVPLDQPGLICFKGANVFTGYLNQPEKTKEVIDADGWFQTGDFGRFDDDGFLHIEGRLSRFSKIGGEMVPHETVEQQINSALGLEQEDERKIAVVGLPDEEKGEVLILLASVPVESPSQEIVGLRHTLLERGMPSLWIPKVWVPVDEIPLLASGKLDLKSCEDKAREGR